LQGKIYKKYIFFLASLQQNGRETIEAGRGAGEYFLEDAQCVTIVDKKERLQLLK
jgi:hypothetical protein